MAFGIGHYKYFVLTCVVNYSAVANAFIKLNCIPASSAAEERLFSAFAQVLTAGRWRLQNKMLHMHIFLKPFLSIEA